MAQKEFTTALSEWTKSVTNLVTKDFDSCGVDFSDYSKKCAMSAMTSIYQLVKSDINNINTSNLREIVGQAASLQLNASAMPRECYFQLRKKKEGDTWVQVVEMGVEGDGNDAILRNFGENIDTVYPVWIVKEGDEFIYPKFKGIEISAPEWEQKGQSEKVARVVYPIKLKDGSFQYLIAERESVKINLFAHVRNNLMNETFGICANRYKATEEQLKQIQAKKDEIYAALRACETLDDMLKCEVAKPYISAAWLDTPEAMIARKLRNNAIKKYPKNFNTMAQQSFVQLDETYVQAQNEIEANENAQEFVVEGEATVISE